jgi:hypothetical protein
MTAVTTEPLKAAALTATWDGVYLSGASIAGTAKQIGDTLNQLNVTDIADTSFWIEDNKSIPYPPSLRTIWNCSVHWADGGHGIYGFMEFHPLPQRAKECSTQQRVT